MTSNVSRTEKLDRLQGKSIGGSACVHKLITAAADDVIAGTSHYSQIFSQAKAERVRNLVASNGHAQQKYAADSWIDFAIGGVLSTIPTSKACRISCRTGKRKYRTISTLLRQ